MKNIILYGAPAAGKGTQCELLIEKYGYNHISTGQLFRDLDDSNEFNKSIKETIASGNLVDDETTSQLVKNKLDSLEGLVVLDGFPRNLNQAKFLDEFFTDYIVINIDVDYEEAKKRVLGRMTCSKCGKIYNEFTKEMIPKVANICDNCNVELDKRTDDNEESFKTRFDIYMNNVSEVLGYYRNKNLLYIVKSVNPQETFEQIESVLVNGNN